LIKLLENKMKLKSTLLAAMLAIFAASTATAFAVEEHPADAKAGTGEVKKPAKKKVKKHNHMEEKTGMPMSGPAAGTDKQGSMKDMPMHDHTKDKH
jgi:hypothetical protein